MCSVICEIEYPYDKVLTGCLAGTHAASPRLTSCFCRNHAIVDQRQLFLVEATGQIEYLVVAIMKKELGLKQSLYEILQILSITLFQNELITQVLMKTKPQNQYIENHNQLLLFDL